ncbi:hypothetical protein PGT21_017680 [Puccinia graminis f. sp. tritici]|uniref:Uncharacterized protein n=1 Tax=Puccinia graminis f. sp. tritici TaxID=56615 RepID=A0A5B0NKN9_PUCGR|nr:hypothetical protein PGT21_017680 [Puccinia graminis f. sp. tritici]KAA1089797.1 hypothetical protein PGTUg99_014060 [Puccinia graminis f. sp. tritici]
MSSSSSIEHQDPRSGTPPYPYVDGNQTWKRMSFLTVSSFGTQFLWSTEMSQASPYLLSLGISKSQVALVLMAGPLSGLFTQPIVGLYGDKNQHKLGRRRPFIISGGLCTLVSLFTFAWCKELAELIFDVGSQSHQRLSILLAVIAFYALDISINIVTVSNKCLIIDVLPSREQQLANAYASRFSGISAILSTLISLLDLPKLFKSSSSQLKMISYIGGPVFFFSHLMMCMTVHEARFVISNRSCRVPATNMNNSSLVSIIGSTCRKFWEAWRALEGTIVKPICWIQLWAWLGWFPVMFYSSTWVGEIWVRTTGDLSRMDDDDQEKATRIGTIGLLLQSLLSLLGWLFIPRFVSNYRRKHYQIANDYGKTLVDLWACSQLCFGFLLLISPFCEHHLVLSILLIGACGIPWAITCWVPFTLLGEAILFKSESVIPVENNFRLLSDTEPVDSGDRSLSSTDDQLTIPLQLIKKDKALKDRPVLSSLDRSEEETDNGNSTNLINERERETVEEEQALIEEGHNYDDHANDDESGRREDEGSQLAGTVLGIHNVFIVLPQFMISCLSSVLFKLLESDHLDTPRPHSSRPPVGELNPLQAHGRNETHGISEIGIIFRFGGIASLVSGLFCWKLGRLIHHKFLSSS